MNSPMSLAAYSLVGEALVEPDESRSTDQADKIIKIVLFVPFAPNMRGVVGGAKERDSRHRGIHGGR